MHEIELPNDSHRKKIEHVKESILAMKERTKILQNTILQLFELYVPIQWSDFLLLNSSWIT